VTQALGNERRKPTDIQCQSSLRAESAGLSASTTGSALEAGRIGSGVGPKGSRTGAKAGGYRM